MNVVLTIVVPSHNSQDYLERCLDSIVPADDDVEVIVVDDGSTDATSGIARAYAERHPGTVRVIGQPNGGHGSAINTGLRAARGRYFKVLDSDDRLVPAALSRLLRFLRTADAGQDAAVDLVVTNFVYDKVGKRRKHVSDYRNVLPAGRTVGWDELGRFGPSQVLHMHALTYRTAVLRECGIVLPQHTFYVDNLFSFVPLSHVERIHYLDLDLYSYFIGRPDQSVNEDVLLRRIDQQLRVNRMMIDALPARRQVPARLRRYLVHDLGLVCAVSSIMLIRSGTAAHLEAKARLWEYLYDRDEAAYRRLRRSRIGTLLHLPGRPGRRISVLAYRAAQEVIGFN